MLSGILPGLARFAGLSPALVTERRYAFRIGFFASSLSCFPLGGSFPCGILDLGCVFLAVCRLFFFPLSLLLRLLLSFFPSRFLSFLFLFPLFPACRIFFPLFSF